LAENSSISAKISAIIAGVIGSLLAAIIIWVLNRYSHILSVFPEPSRTLATIGAVLFLSAVIFLTFILLSKKLRDKTYLWTSGILALVIAAIFIMVPFVFSDDIETKCAFFRILKSDTRIDIYDDGHAVLTRTQFIMPLDFITVSTEDDFASTGGYGDIDMTIAPAGSTDGTATIDSANIQNCTVTHKLAEREFVIQYHMGLEPDSLYKRVTKIGYPGAFTDTSGDFAQLDIPVPADTVILNIILHGQRKWNTTGRNYKALKVKSRGVRHKSPPSLRNWPTFHLDDVSMIVTLIDPSPRDMYRFEWVYLSPRNSQPDAGT